MMTVTLKESQQLWISSDFHYHHRNIVAGVTSWTPGRGQRPFQTLEEMNERLVQTLNTNVAAGDILVCLGDWAFGNANRAREFREQINCTDIRLVLGNHDHDIRRNKGDLQTLFTKVCTMVDMRVQGQDFVLLHYPLAVWDGIGRGVMHLHGHSHRRPEKRFGPGRMMDVGLDGHPDFCPYNVEEIIDLLKDRPLAGLLPGDYHELEGL